MKLTPQQAATEIARYVIPRQFKNPGGTVDSPPVPNPVVVISVGVPGSGKSTFTKLLRERFEEWNIPPFTVASTDDLVDKWAAAHGMTYSEAWDKCPMKEFNRQFKEDIELAVLMKSSLVIDRTNMGKKTRRGHLEMIPAEYKKYCVNFDVDTVILKERLKARSLATGKTISDLILGSMFKNYEPPTRDEGFDEIIVIDNNKSFDVRF